MSAEDYDYIPEKKKRKYKNYKKDFRRKGKSVIILK